MAKKIILGTNLESGAPVTIDERARARSIYSLGIPGVGKSNLLEAIAYQDMVNGDGLLFLDPHGDSVRRLLELVPAKRERDVIFWNLADRTCPIGIQPFHCPNSDDYDAKADLVVAAFAAIAEFADIFKTAPQMKNIMHHLAIAFVVNQGHTLIETPRFLQDENFRRTFYSKLDAEYPQVRKFWEEFDEKKAREQDEFIASTLNKLQRFGLNRTMQAMFGQRVPKLNIKRIMDEGKIVLVFMNREKIGPDNAALIGSFIVSEILQATLARIDTPPDKRRPFHVIADEFQTFMSTAFPTLIAEGRKYGVDETIAHQVREQLEGDIRELTRAVGNIIVFRVTSPNADALAGEFKNTQPKPVAPLVSDPWRYLLTGGHTNPEVYTAVSSIQSIISEVSKQYESEREHAGAQEAGARVADFHRQVGQYLYRRMSGKAGTRFMAEPQLSALNAIIDGFFTIRYSGYYGYLEYRVTTMDQFSQAQKDIEARFSQVRDKQEEKIRRAKENLEERQATWEHIRAERDYAWKQFDFSHPLGQLDSRYNADRLELDRKFPSPSVHSPMKQLELALKETDIEIRWAKAPRDGLLKILQERFSLSRRFVDAMEHLGDILSREPITTNPQTYEVSRTQADQRAEIAGRLTNLERFHALCKLEGDTEIQNALIVTNIVDACPDTARAETIKRRSQDEYGAYETPRPFDTMNTDGQTDDDNPVEFGEKKTSRKPETSIN